MTSPSHSHSSRISDSDQPASSPSRPVPIASSCPAPQDDFEHTPTPQGTPDLRSLRAHFDPPPLDLPPRNSMPGSGITSPPFLSSSPARSPLVRRGSGTPPPTANLLEDLSDTEKAKVLRRHLVSRDERNYAGSVADSPTRPGTPLGSVTQGPSSLAPPQDSEIFPIPYDVPGGDVTHDIYKWQADREIRRTRSASFSGTQGSKHPAFEHIREPGGFRRNYLLLRSEEQDAGDPWGSGEGGRTRMLSNFIDFLYLFGHFAGEDLEEEDEEQDEADDLTQATLRANTEENGLVQPSTALLSQSPTLVDDTHVGVTEQSPLLKRAHSLGRRRRTRRLSSTAGESHGDATVTQAVLMLLKSFIGTGVLFLGKAFLNGGLLFSTVTLVLIAIVSLWAFLLLVRTKLVVSGSFGDIGGTLYGAPMRFAILSSITISQIGFTCAYLIFVASNLQAFIMAVTKCATYVSILHLILAQLVVFLPLAMVRNLAKLSTTALVADAFILIGLVYIFGNEFAILGSQGVADIKWFNPKDYALLIGTAVFSFEGIGLIIPITDSMREPHKFPKALTGVMIFLTVLFAGAGVISYAAYGSHVQTVILLNLPQDQKFVQVVQFLYSMAILLSIPLQLFPAVRIMENGLFTRSGKLDPWVKWEKNAFRCLVIAVCTVISWLGAADLDKFVAFIGSFACVPLCYVYPAMLHYKACARTKMQKLADISLMIFGSVAAVFTTVQTIKLMAEPRGETGPRFGNCPTPGLL